jgi:hypothetical protein
MPLRDHFRAPLDDLTSWEGFHGQWPAMIVLALARQLPCRYITAPRLQTSVNGYEVCVHDNERGRRLVAAVEIVSPANKDRPEHRRAFVAKCVALLEQLVSVTIIDLVTTRNFNLFRELLDMTGQAVQFWESDPPPLYAVACRGTKKDDSWLLETWAHTLTLGQPLPTLPLWLADNLSVPLELEASYEATCQALRIP